MYKNMKRSEDTEQMTLIDWCNINICKYPELRLIYHVPKFTFQYGSTYIRLFKIVQF